jgi:hypothetical protein
MPSTPVRETLHLNTADKIRSQIDYVWTAVEVNLAVICCCMPALRPLLSRWFPKIFPDFSGRTGGTGGNNESMGASLGVGGSSRSRPDAAASSHHILKDLHPYRKKQQSHTEIRGTSPTGSEEEIMTYNGILRTTNFNVRYENAKGSDRGSKTSSDLASYERSTGNHV